MPASVAAIAVVIPYYNGSRFIAEALASVQAQTLPPAEVIVVDDGSRPEEAALLDKHAHSATILHQANGGAAAARNAGVTAATSEWIAFLDCDDLWTPNRLEVLSRHIDQHPGCLAVHNAVQLMDSKRIHHKTALEARDFLMHAEAPSPVMPSAAMVRRDVFQQAGMMDTTIRIVEDYDFFLRVSLLGTIHYVDEPLTLRRRHDANSSSAIGIMLLHKNRIVARNRPRYANDAEFQGQVLRLNAEYLTRAIYQRDWKTASLAFRLAREQDVAGVTLAATGLSRLIRQKLSSKA